MDHEQSQARRDTQGPDSAQRPDDDERVPEGPISLADVHEDRGIEDKERPWDEGLTPQERADAKRRYKNRKGVERWRRRKQAQRAKEKQDLAQGTASEDATEPSRETGSSRYEEASSSTPQRGWEPEEREGPQMEDLTASKDKNAVKPGNKGSSSDPSSDEVIIPEWTPTNRMLHEFARLGKAKEAKMKTKLDMLASYAMIPHGFQRHKGRIVRLAEECLEIARDGEPSTRDVAQRFLGWGIKFNSQWEDPEIPNFQQIMNVFAKGEDNSTFVNVTLPNGSRRSISLRQLSRFDEAVHKEVYVGLLHQILREMPLALLKTQAAHRAKANIINQMKQASMFASGYVIGQFVSFTTQRAIRKNVAVPMQGMMYAAASLGLRHDSCRRLWQVWDAAKLALEPLIEKHHILEQRLDSLLIMHDISNDGSYLAIFDAVEQLMKNFEEQFDISYYADLKCSHELLNPLQLGLLAAAQVPKMPVRQILAEDIDPYTRISVVFESGAVPRYQ